MPEASRKSAAHQGSGTTSTTLPASRAMVTRGATTEKRTARPSALSSASMVVSSSREKAAKLQIESFSRALDLYFLDNGRYPTASEGLEALVKRPPAADKWGGPYADSLPSDPWGNPYEYRVPGTKAPYAITSHGSDGQKGGTDEGADISNE